MSLENSEFDEYEWKFQSFLYDIVSAGESVGAINRLVSPGCGHDYDYDPRIEKDLRYAEVVPRVLNENLSTVESDENLKATIDSLRKSIFVDLSGFFASAILDHAEKLHEVRKYKAYDSILLAGFSDDLADRVNQLRVERAEEALIEQDKFTTAYEHAGRALLSCDLPNRQNYEIALHALQVVMLSIETAVHDNQDSELLEIRSYHSLVKHFTGSQESARDKVGFAYSPERFNSYSHRFLDAAQKSFGNGNYASAYSLAAALQSNLRADHEICEQAKEISQRIFETIVQSQERHADNLELAVQMFLDMDDCDQDSAFQMVSQIKELACENTGFASFLAKRTDELREKHEKNSRWLKSLQGVQEVVDRRSEPELIC